jgi:peptide/nickel transport system substrate-binding protein
MRAKHCVALLTAASVATLAGCGPVPQTNVLRVVPHADLEILDPIFTTASITRNHGYMIYDTLFGTDASGRIQPQMVDTWDVSPDRKTWTFRLRDGLTFHDGAPVTSEDVILSLQRWGQRDQMGQTLFSFIAPGGLKAVDAKTFQMTLTFPYGLVLESLGKPDSNVPFIMPARVARTPANQKIDDPTGSGPFIFKKDEWKPGARVVYVKNGNYKPRNEPPSGTAGGKVAKMARVEWVIIKDAQTQASALVANEIDILEAPAFEQVARLKSDPAIHLITISPLWSQYFLRFNHIRPPFDNPQVRRAAMAALNQQDLLSTQVGVTGLYRTCFSVYSCGSPYFTRKGMEFLEHPDPEHARTLLQQSGYKGEPVVFLEATDVVRVRKVPAIAAQLLGQAGFKIELKPMPWNTVLEKVNNRKEDWNIFMATLPGMFVMNPLSNLLLSGAGDKARVGWPCDGKLENLRLEFARAADEPERKLRAEQVQMRAMEVGTHVPLGEHALFMAVRNGVKGIVIGHGPMVLWNVEKD